jgi:hypothetical protein
MTPARKLEDMASREDAATPLIPLSPSYFDYFVFEEERNQDPQMHK